MSYTARFLAYARHIGMPPDECKAGVGFILWVREKLAEWRKQTGKTGSMLAADHAAFDAWLES